MKSLSYLWLTLNFTDMTAATVFDTGSICQALGKVLDIEEDLVSFVTGKADMYNRVVRYAKEEQCDYGQAFQASLVRREYLRDECLSIIRQARLDEEPASPGTMDPLLSYFERCLHGSSRFYLDQLQAYKQVDR